MNLYLNPATWEKPAWPGLRDPRWAVFCLLSAYLTLGITVLGFTRTPLQIIVALSAGALLDVIFCGLLKGKWIFPLSAVITTLSLTIILSFSSGYHFIWLPVLIAIASKYIFTLNGRHIYNPSLFAIVFSLIFADGWISIAPAYQWTGSAETAWLMSITILTAGVTIFGYRGSRKWLALSFLTFFAIQLLIRSYIIRYHLPASALFIGTITSPSFYLFTFFMITDPATSPPDKRTQILVGFFLAIFDLAYHLKFSLFTFFYAAFTLATIRYVVAAWKTRAWSGALRSHIPAAILTFFFAIPAFAMYESGQSNVRGSAPPGLHFTRIASSQSGIGYEKSNILEQVDPRVQHIAKWLLSVGDSVASADVDLDGKPDLFFTQSLKSTEYRGKLYLNQGNFQFKKIVIPDLERYLNDPAKFGLPAFAFFFDYDNDGDQDLFVGFGYGRSHMFENRIKQEGIVRFREIETQATKDHTIALAANAFDFNRDGRLDVLVANTLPVYLPDYLPEKIPLNIFKLPEPRYEGDRRMLHFMHHSWHNANNGGKNELYLGTKGPDPFSRTDVGLDETRWSLSVGTADLNRDGFTDIYIANDFGRDDCYINDGGKRFRRQQGEFFEDLGLDTYKGMNASMGDIDGNGADDVYVSNVHHPMQAEGSLLWMNYTASGAQNLSMKDRASQRGALNPHRFGWGAAMADLDLDGKLDIVQANGMVSNKWDKRYATCLDYWYLNEKLARSIPEIHTYADNWADLRGACIYPDEADRIYINQGSRFSDFADDVGVTHRANTRGVAAVDLDNDGDLDLVFTDQFGEPIIYRNDINKPSWAGLILHGNGRTCNRDAVGSTVELKSPSISQHREVRLVNGFSAQSDTRLLFAVTGSARAVIQWCGQEIQEIDLPAGRYTTLEQR
ncbi:MAG: FG-GAP-like repeat-containing protein [Leptospirales bacterium]|nr:FG-GAP-like repeat-containing protein [Leptospirales bacterium]